ncbi:MAG: tRNA (cytidine(34)-2'-O)-methyltransferase [Candidatus Gastranaerophilaceae bacterium]|jgi:RNA methyltransferase, trmH family, group 2|uniref:Putative tRNA (cytidine(34)-2'-O)-methyltransferase n=1 Tax=Candidatus Limenecus avicola TaxID=2840847 RepID=A0A9D1SRB8_9CLOT|nr:tRNA (cytidine(34)-2'-O)-methyltransferase [Clostridium sp.]CDC17959.1 putative tRNA (cytidine(34)-2'-O)-methyltransferase [Clostridium sp. CAG:306]HIU92334.1 tRNA (cytidine(34)-2'-O)-methyltransferase [Candidatus Limenecus avicola]
MKITTKLNIVLYEPEIPQNTGNIVRLAACTNSDVFLVGKLGFSIDSRHLKRAGLDYWGDVNIRRIEKIEDLWQEFPDNDFYYLTTKTQNYYTDVKYKDGDFLVFGPESRGIPEELLFSKGKHSITIPMQDGQRSLNLSNSVAIVVYEALRQING